MNPTVITILIVAGIAALLYRFVFYKKHDGPGWAIGPTFLGKNYSRNMPKAPTPLPGGVWSLTVKPGAKLDGVTISRGAISGAIRLRYRVTGAGLYPSAKPDEIPTGPAVLALYFEHDGDTGTMIGKYGTYRWDSVECFPLTPGEHSVTLPFDPALWGSVLGPTGDTQPRPDFPGIDFIGGFADALAAKGRIGLAFGWAGGRMHGNETTADVKFELLEWVVGQPDPSAAVLA